MELNTIEKIENNYWDEPDENSTGLIKTIFSLRKKDINSFSVEDLRIMIGQNEALNLLMPFAIERLNENVLAEGNYYDGDLLVNVLRTDSNF